MAVTARPLMLGGMVNVPPEPPSPVIVTEMLSALVVYVNWACAAGTINNSRPKRPGNVIFMIGCRFPPGRCGCPQTVTNRFGFVKRFPARVITVRAAQRLKQGVLAVRS